MSDIKLFILESTNIRELSGQAVQVEKSLQELFESNLEALLGIRFLESEHSTGPVHGGRIDTLGLDEDNCPAIIEYKRAINENVINQRLFYLDWLLDHRKEFQWLVMEKLGAEVAKQVDWSTPRLLCIAGDFSRYDEHSVKQIARNIVLLELVHAPKQARTSPPVTASDQKSDTSTVVIDGDPDPYTSQRIGYRISQADKILQDLFEAIRQFLIGLGDDVQVKELKNYIAFRRFKNFVCLELYPQARVVTAYLKIDPSTVEIEEGFSRNVTNIGHFGTGKIVAQKYGRLREGPAAFPRKL